MTKEEGSGAQYHGGELPPLRPFLDDGDTAIHPTPEFSSLDHFRLVEWVREALSMSTRQTHEHLNKATAHLQGQISELVAVVRALDERGEAAGRERRELAAKLDDISAQMNQLLGQVSIEAGQRGWLNPRHFPYMLTAVVVMFIFALIWGIVFGDDSVATTLERVRGSAPSQPNSGGSS